MKAMVQREYGLDVALELRELTEPIPGEDQVRIRVEATGLHPGDRHVMRGRPYVLRLMGFGLRRPRQPVPGTDVAGRVEAVGPGVTRLRPGDAVFGSTRGALAEQVVAGADMFVRRPEGLSAAEAAVVPESGLTALRALRDLGEVAPGARVLVIGASGGVGTFAVQIAKALGATVTGVASARNADLVRALGADRVVAYDAEHAPTHTEPHDVVLDAVGSQPIRDLRRLLAPGGVLVLVGGQGGRMLGGVGRFAGAAMRSPFVPQRLRPLIGGDEPPGADLEALARMIESGHVRPVIEREFSFHEAADAMRRLDAGHARGKLVVVL